MRNPSILIVDDEERSRTGISFTLQKWKKGKIHIDEAENGVDALEMLRSKDYDLLILDIKMPLMTGLETLQQLREENNEITCVLLTGFAEFEYAQQGIKLGAIDYLLKPIQQEELIQSVQKGLENAYEKHKTVVNDSLVEVTTNNPSIEKALAYIDKNLHHPLTVIEVANKVHLNANYFSVLFKNETGFTFTDYIIQKKLEKAKYLLITTHLSLEEITEKIGYQTASYFIRIFKRQEKLTPNEYRTKMRKVSNSYKVF